MRAQPEPFANFVGEIDANFASIRRLGDGAEGGAWVAIERATGRRVVLKRVPAAQARDVRYAFQVLRRTGSPHLPAPRALLRASDGAGWMVTDWVPGDPLAPIRAERGADALAEARAVAHALAAIHGAGTHHGDVSPANIVVTPTGGVVLIDLGQLGRHGMGTPGYLAPEVLAGGGGPSADRFSLGCVLCLRLLGETPWQRPEVLMQVRDAAAVQARLDALGGTALDRPVRELLTRLLDPRPERRIGDPSQLVARLTRLHAAADAGLDLRRSEPWWPPTRWPYQGGASLTPTVERLGQREPPRLVAVSGPPGSGRGRVIEELIQTLQTDRVDRVARVSEPCRLAAVLGRPGMPWLEAWRTACDERIVGVLEAPTWPEGLAEGAIASRAAVLQQVTHQARATLVLPVSPELGAALAERGGVVLRVASWSATEIERVLEGVVDPDTRAAWAQRLHGATGGWPARVIRAAEACARAELEEPTAPQVADVIADAVEPGHERLDLGTARAVMLAVWGGAGATAALPAHLHDGERPWATVEAAARSRLGSQLAELAHDMVAATEGEGEPPGLSLAIDADRAEIIEARLATLDEESRALARWLDGGGASRLGASTVAAVMRHRLARGDVEAALRLAPHASSPPGQLLTARALQRTGQLEAALRHADSAAESDQSDVAWSARGLRWRLWIDQGEGARALLDARGALAEAPAVGLGSATAHLWAAMAALVAGDHDLASTWLEAAVIATVELVGPEVAGIKARAQQLHGNLAQARGELRNAQRDYAAAAEAFELAGEPVGGLMLRGSLTGVAVLAYDFAAGIEHGRAAMGGLLARGQISATLEAGINLLQLLVRTGAEDQARALGRLLEELHGHTDTELVRARLARARAELAVVRVRPDSRGTAARGTLAAAESSFVVAAKRLATASAPAESAEAWRRAASLARAQRQRTRARAHLEQARLVAGDEPCPDAAAELELELAWVELADDQPHALTAALERLARLPRPEVWRERGRVDLAWSYDRTLLAALRRRLPTEHPARRRVAQRWLATLELVMKQTGPLDRSAVRSTLFVDGGDTQPLRDLLAELDEPVPAARGTAPAVPIAPVTPVASTEQSRAEQLLRIYRRLAREDRLELLLQQVVDSMMDLTDAERGAVVVLPTAHTERLEVTRELAEGSEGVRFSRSVIERVLADGEPVMSVDAAADDRFDGSRSISHLNLRSVLAVPLQFRGERLGAAYVDHRLRRGNFDEKDLARMEEFAELAALAVAHARALAELRAQAGALEVQQVELSRLLEAREAEVIGLREEVRAQGPVPRGYRGIIGSSEVMTRVFRLIERVADADVPVVIHGESGTGKELVARAIHEAGSRGRGPFIGENCGAIPETLLESVLFGHIKGAFTGAGSSKAGLFEAANGGTIFLDEVGEMSAAMQTKLLRVLQEGELRRVGDSRARPIDVRVIAASNRDLEAMVENGEFRRDLYYRINVVKLKLPPLRERLDDLPALVEHFMARHRVEDRPLGITPAVMRCLRLHPWPGNVRELENEVQRWVALVEGEVRPEDLSMSTTIGTGVSGGVSGGVSSGSGGEPGIGETDDLQIRPRIERMERALITRAMEKTGGNQTRAAGLLGLSRYGLQKKLKRFAERNGDA